MERFDLEKAVKIVGLETYAERADEGRDFDVACRMILQAVEKQIESTETEVCKWIKYDYRTIVPKYHDIDNPYWRIPENMDKLKFCPYCGKEIKVVN